MNTTMPTLTRAGTELLSGAVSSHLAGHEAFCRWAAYEAGTRTLKSANAMMVGEPEAQISSEELLVLAWAVENHLAGPETFERSLESLAARQSQHVLAYALVTWLAHQCVYQRIQRIQQSMLAVLDTLEPGDAHHRLN